MKTPAQFTYAPSVSSTLYPPEKEQTNGNDKEILSQYKSAITIYDGRTVPVHWSASQLLQEHERRHSPYGQNDGEHFGNESGSNQADNVSRGSAPFSGSYHLGSGSATYGIADDMATNLYSHNDTPPSETRDFRPYSIEYEGSSVEHDHNYMPPTNNNINKMRPPTFPKPVSASASVASRLATLPLHGSFSSLASERKKQRNVTQV